MKFIPHNYQTNVMNKVLHEYAPYKTGFGFFLEMGLGKTVCALTIIDELIKKGELKKILVIGTIRVIDIVWEDEINKWDHTNHLTYTKILGSEKTRLKAMKSNSDIYGINRENVQWLVSIAEKEGWQYDCIIIDELTSFKSHAASRFRALRKVTPLSKLVIGMTGSPQPNGAIDLWSEMYLLDRGVRLGRNITEYRNRYFTPDKGKGYIVYSWKLKNGAFNNITSYISDICFSMKTEDYIKLPSRTDLPVYVKLPEKARLEYNELEKTRVLPLVGMNIIAAEAGVLVNKLMQISNGAVYDENRDVHIIHDEKLKALNDIVEEANGQPILIFYSYQHDMNRIMNEFPLAVELKTKDSVDRWNRGEIPILVAHPASAGHGLNLQNGGHIIVWFGMTYNLEHYIQGNARIYRQGQTAPVVIYHIIGKNTIDENIMKILVNKNYNQNLLMEALKMRIKDIT